METMLLFSCGIRYTLVSARRSSSKQDGVAPLDRHKRTVFELYVVGDALVQLDERRLVARHMVGCPGVKVLVYVDILQGAPENGASALFVEEDMLVDKVGACRFCCHASVFARLRSGYCGSDIYCHDSVFARVNCDRQRDLLDHQETRVVVVAGLSLHEAGLLAFFLAAVASPMVGDPTVVTLVAISVSAVAAFAPTDVNTGRAHTFSVAAAAATSASSLAVKRVGPACGAVDIALQMHAPFLLDEQQPSTGFGLAVLVESFLRHLQAAGELLNRECVEIDKGLDRERHLHVPAGHNTEKLAHHAAIRDRITVNREILDEPAQPHAEIVDGLTGLEPYVLEITAETLGFCLAYGSRAHAHGLDRIPCLLRRPPGGEHGEHLWWHCPEHRLESGSVVVVVSDAGVHSVP